MSVGTTGALILGGSAVLGAGASLGGAAIGAGATKDAAAAAAAAQQQAIAAQQALAKQGLDILGQQNAYAQQTLAPFIESQKKALGGLEAFSDPNNPLYGQERDLATRQIQQQLAAQGLLRSRSQGDSLANLELGLGQQRLGVLQGLAGTGAGQASAALSQGYGQGAAGLLGGLAPQIGSSLSQLGQIQGQGILGAGQYRGQGLSGVANAFQGAVGSGFNYSLFQKLLGGGGGGGSSLADLEAAIS